MTTKKKWGYLVWQTLECGHTVLSIAPYKYIARRRALHTLAECSHCQRIVNVKHAEADGETRVPYTEESTP